jgi:ABC-type nitrate/sulfonate/bicarbonate transport system permease component
MKINKIKGYYIIFLLILIWELYSRFSSKLVFLPPFSEVITQFSTSLIAKDYLVHILFTVLRTLSGFLVACLIMLPLGVLFGRNKNVYSYFEKIIEFLRPMPSAAIIPIAILFLGIEDNMKIFVICFGSSWPILINTIDGVKSVEPMYIKTGMVYNFSNFKIFTKILIPASLPVIFTGFRISIAIALILAITVEMIVGGNGLGYYILDAERSFKFSEMYSGIFTVGIIGYFINYSIVKLENKFLYWHKKSNQIK